MARRSFARVVAGIAVLATGLGLGIAVPGAGGVAGASPVGAHWGHVANDNARHGTYLALGDSVAFGYVPPNATPAPNYQDASSFVSYANDVAAALRDPLSNASCPGETTASMLTASAQSNGCENSVGSPFGYRTFFPLHVAYQGSQISYALSYLTSPQHHTHLVTIDIGANDAFVCEATTADHCTSQTELTGLATEIETNLSKILSDIRDVAHYSGPLVVLDYYALTYSSPAATEQAAFLNQAINAAANPFHAIIANGYAAFQAASKLATGSPCKAGLLIPVATTASTPTGGCNIHPSHLGHQVLAASILFALATAHATSHFTSVHL